MILSNDFGIDPGSFALKIYDRYNDSFYSEKNAIAADSNGHVFAWGEDAYQMKGSTPRSISVRSSVSEGKITDVFLLEAVIEPVLYREHRFLGIRPQIYFSVPADMTEIERRAYASISRRGRLKNCDVFLVERAYADAISLGLSVADAKGIMLINIGASHTTASVISNGNIILERLIPCGGTDFNEHILALIRKKNNLLIGELAAEKLKTDLCDFSEVNDTGVSISGIDTINGLPRDGYVTSRTITGAVREKMDELLSAIEDFIHRIPPQVLEHVKNQGLYLTGGSSIIPGIGNSFSERLKLKVNVSDRYDYSTVYGLKEIINNNQYKDMIKSPSLRKNK